ncbi:hypothetical protein Tco_1228450 [Tanacetum coccineum]
MGTCSSPLSVSKTSLMFSVKVGRYITNTSPLIGVLLSALKKGSDFSTPFYKNRLSAANFSLRLCISLSVFGVSRSVTALTFEGGALYHNVINEGLKISSSLVAEYFIYQRLGFPPTVMVLGIPVISVWVHEKMSTFNLRRTCSLFLKFMAPWIVDTMIPILYMAVLPRSRLCGELDLTMTKLRTFVLLKGLSPIVISKGTSPRGQKCSPEKPKSGTFESTLSDLMECFNFRKQCS